VEALIETEPPHPTTTCTWWGWGCYYSCNGRMYWIVTTEFWFGNSTGSCGVWSKIGRK